MDRRRPGPAVRGSGGCTCEEQTVAARTAFAIVKHVFILEKPNTLLFLLLLIHTTQCSCYPNGLVELRRQSAHDNVTIKSYERECDMLKVKVGPLLLPYMAKHPVYVGSPHGTTSLVGLFLPYMASAELKQG